MAIEYRKNGEVLFVFDQQPAAKKVFLVGDFNDWDTEARRMTRSKDGVFKAKLKLTPGEYGFRFFVDGDWVNDANTDQRPNPFGTSDSIIRVA